ncbi:MAG: hypothetical protein QG635_1412 [Bacteroidota bacterium]|nr:hypothetical protein [Bacteroidota bacterium]
MYKELFTLEEWYLLETAVIWMFQAIAGADGRVDVDELNAMNIIKEKAGLLENHLSGEVLSSMQYDIEHLNTIYSFDIKNIRTGLRELSDILKQKINSDESLLFKKTLLALGTIIANASGSYLTQKISDVEAQTLHELALHLRIGRTEMDKLPTVYDIMQIFDTSK